ncbi:MAG TPA: arsenate reductase (glutaredoxin) [Bacteroidales bacterium]|nr:MAG: arsenate reductase (glutaredoxin) [Bacteroidetes bacterium GWF2_33_38]OFY75874.1 MAG: arsenate reductase (glutaredoxin) [Bacteroidetes bacterium RIFOXYA12_FULL_33_9]OFY92236.1 MAG: arsenate reductase (glutaredoxin) [Bacteroidetes bacterium RIFOXYA2_FULL_33_7]HBF87399.1 arsenate reductase (glutaredoxin) [Bacteroidales bacterium]
MLKIYHNPRCKKSREGLQYLQAKGVQFEIIEYLKKPLTEKEIQELLMLLNKKPHEIIRTQEEIYKNEYKNLQLTDNEWIKIISKNPILLQRPIVAKKHKAVIGQPPQNIDILL